MQIVSPEMSKPLFWEKLEKKNINDLSSAELVQRVVTINTFCLCWGFTVHSTQWGHVERGQFT